MGCDVVPASKAVTEFAKSVALDLDLGYAESYTEATTEVALVVDLHAAWLQKLEKPRAGPVAVNFSAPDMLHRRKSGHNEPLGRAVGIKRDKRPKVFDATAGLGRDAFVLADLGCEVELCEASSALYYLLWNAREAALMSSNEKVADAARRMTVSRGDSRSRLLEDIDVIYLDPMFPDRSKSAAVKKDLATVQALHIGVADDGGLSLLEWALDQPVSRIVLKRPSKAVALGDVKPSHAIVGKTVRFDVIVR